eukprot:CAMPEP_0184431868 /NCGR_PEP_ID=MMETSP0738-20130409/327395_1 /TAXON_ID=385413 /ORGANISM="Thalassiosira miniscula, Strain CCMP1093" /LENGTH=82 /DNA_ID=CAMNT_0026796999 /DNA_START=287 /DNA_END=536 /DNA_ORIENTATION=-
MAWDARYPALEDGGSPILGITVDASVAALAAGALVVVAPANHRVDAGTGGGVAVEMVVAPTEPLPQTLSPPLAIASPSQPSS